MVASILHIIIIIIVVAKQMKDANVDCHVIDPRDQITDTQTHITSTEGWSV